MERSFRNFSRRLRSADLYDEVETFARTSHVSMHELYEGPDRAPSIIIARRATYLWLLEEGKSVKEIARLFDRAPNGVWKLTRKKES